MGLDLSRIGERDRLKPKRGDEPHWQRLRFGAFIGFRPSQLGGKGTWFARAYDEDAGKYQRKALGDFGTLTGHEVFTTARKEAEAWAETVEAGGVAPTKVETVADACTEYAAINTEATGRFGRHFYGDPIGKVKLAKLRRHHLAAWRKRLEAKPALVSRRKKGTPVTRPRAPSSINRDMAMLRAALNKVLAPGKPGTEAAWQEPLRSIKNADRQRTLYLDRTQRRTLLAGLPADAEAFVRASCLLPLRPGAFAVLKVADFDGRTSELTIGKDKNGKPRRIVLPSRTAEFFAAQAQSKQPSDLLFTRADGKPWSKETWNDPIRKSASAGQLPAGITSYVLRHSTITDLVMARLPLLTVAQISGTSAEMIEKHYGHLARAAATDALETLIL